MSEPTKVYAVVSGEHSNYEVHAIYRRREDLNTDELAYVYIGDRSRT